MKQVAVGEFGVVYRGHLIDVKGTKPTELVAVKTLKEGESEHHYTMVVCKGHFVQPYNSTLKLHFHSNSHSIFRHHLYLQWSIRVTDFHHKIIFILTFPSKHFHNVINTVNTLLPPFSPTPGQIILLYTCTLTLN